MHIDDGTDGWIVISVYVEKEKDGGREKQGFNNCVMLAKIFIPFHLIRALNYNFLMH